MSVDPKKIAPLKAAVQEKLAQIAAGKKALEQMERDASPAIEALVNEGNQLGPYKFGADVYHFRKRSDGRYLVKPASEAL